MYEMLRDNAIDMNLIDTRSVIHNYYQYILLDDLYFDCKAVKYMTIFIKFTKHVTFMNFSIKYFLICTYAFSLLLLGDDPCQQFSFLDNIYFSETSAAGKM